MTDGASQAKNITERDQQPEVNKETGDDDLTPRTANKDIAKNNSIPEEGEKETSNGKLLGKLEPSSIDHTCNEVTNKLQQTAPVTSTEGNGNKQKDAKKEEELRTPEPRDKSNEERSGATGNLVREALPDLVATKLLTSKPNASDVVADVVGKVAEETSAPPVAPPRRRKKKKLVAEAVVRELHVAYALLGYPHFRTCAQGINK